MCSAVSATSRMLWVLQLPRPLHPSSGLSRAEQVRLEDLSNSPAAVEFILHVTLEGRRVI